uniref:Uncharacterized protein n=1 Tax=Cacopsylla melanoneura TaxID=428564 RepID=A0A8D8VVA3_9HEMI
MLEQRPFSSVIRNLMTPIVKLEPNLNPWLLSLSPCSLLQTNLLRVLRWPVWACYPLSSLSQPLSPLLRLYSTPLRTKGVILLISLTTVTPSPTLSNLRPPYPPSSKRLRHYLPLPSDHSLRSICTYKPYVMN